MTNHIRTGIVIIITLTFAGIVIAGHGDSNPNPWVVGGTWHYLQNVVANDSMISVDLNNDGRIDYCEDADTVDDLDSTEIGYWQKNGNDVYYGGGDVGIGTMTPASALDIAGSLKIGEDSSVCDAVKEGALRYNSANKKVEYCDSTAWNVFLS